MYTWGWWVIAEPQVCRTAVMPTLAPKCLGPAAMGSIVSEAALNRRVGALFSFAKLPCGKRPAWSSLDFVSPRFIIDTHEFEGRALIYSTPLTITCVICQPKVSSTP